jgi:hypothetical protein
VSDVLLRRFRRSLAVIRSRDVSASQAIFSIAPRRILRGLVQPLYAGAYRFHAARKASRHREEVRAALSGHRRMPFVVIAVPDTLHFLIPCLALARRHVPIVLVSNGLRAWERDALAGMLERGRQVRLPAIPGQMIRHSAVVEALLRDARQDFALHDPDLYVLKPSLYMELDLRENEMAVGAFGIRNKKAALSFPTTHLVSLHVSTIRSLCERYAIGPGVYRRTPRRLASSLRALGIGDDNFPKDYLGYYDLLNLVWMVGLHDGHRTRILWSPEEDVVHVGGVSYDLGNPMLHYVHSRFLGLPIVREIAPRYRRGLVGGRSIGEIRKRAQERGLARELQRVDERIERLCAALETA